MNVRQEYINKLRTPEEAVKIVKDNDWIDYTVAQGQPVLLDAALAKRKGEVKNVNCRGYFMFEPIRIVEDDPKHESFTYHSWYTAGIERKYWQQGLISFLPMFFRCQHLHYERGYTKVNVAMMCVGPMDDDGFFSLHFTCATAKPVLDAADVVIVEVNEHLPKVYGINERIAQGIDVTRIHISQVDYVVEGPHHPPVEIKSAPPTEAEIAIANYILPNIPDGAVLQLGVGGMPNVLGEYLANSDIKDLGCHTELMTDAFLKLYKQGKLTNYQKALHRGRSIFGLCAGSQELYDWVGNNPRIQTDLVSYINDPYIISQNPKQVSINGCITADIYGQVCSESSGTRQISGTGGQVDFIEGAMLSVGGHSFVCMTSVHKGKNGELKSNILPKFTEGDIITTPRAYTDYIVTEQGIANLIGKNTWQRAEEIIKLAHPDFRDELIRKAEKQGIWKQSNKR